MHNKNVIAIIGGGFCGTMTAVHLLSQKERQLHIVLVNSGYPLSKGIAYSSYSHRHLLNVRAKSMSAFPDKPDHFINWVKKHEKYGAIDQKELPDMFLPRNVYGYYLKEIFETAIRNKSTLVTIDFVHDEAIDIEIKDDRAHISFSVSPPIVADKVVLAIGNQLPRPPQLNNNLFYQSKKYFSNPWTNESVNHPEKNESVLIVGNGLTMVDVVLGLREKNHEGKIYSLSPHGFRILPHRTYPPYPNLLNELRPPYDLVKLIKLFRQHVLKLRAEGVTGEAVVDSLRPLTQEIWLSLTKAEKERFMYHVRHMWGVARHRLPMDLHKKIQRLILEDTLDIVAGKIISIEEKGKDIYVSIRRKNHEQPFEIVVERVINCTGPEGDISKMENALMQNLVARKIVLADEMHLGVLSEPDGTILNEKREKSSNLFTVGTLLRGILWESTAVPELRAQAKKMAEKLCLQLNESQ